MTSKSKWAIVAVVLAVTGGASSSFGATVTCTSTSPRSDHCFNSSVNSSSDGCFAPYSSVTRPYLPARFVCRVASK